MGNYIKIKKDLCKGCGLCAFNCPLKQIQKSGELNKLGYVYYEFKGEKCSACGICFYSCPEPGAIEVIKE